MVNKGCQTDVQVPAQALTAAEMLVPWVSLANIYNVQPEALSRKEPRLAFWPTLTTAGEVGVAMGAVVGIGTAVAVDPVTGITVTRTVVGVADAHAESTSTSGRKW